MTRASGSLGGVSRDLLNAAAIRTPVLLLVVGQSNERGALARSQTAEFAAWPQAFISQRNPGFQGVISPAVFGQGGPWFKVYDLLWDWGYDLRIVNAALGSLSFTKHVAMQVGYANRSSVVFQKRDPMPGSIDRGDFGDVTVQNGNYFRCVVGNKRMAFHSGPEYAVDGATPRCDYIVNSSPQKLTGATAPNWAAATAVGHQVTDGDIVWELFRIGTLGLANGSILREVQAGVGFDPLGVLQRGLEEAGRVAQGVARKFVYIQNAQADMSSTGAGWYAAALKAIANFYADRQFEPFVGLSCYNAAGSNTAAYNTLQTERATALADLQAQSNGAMFRAGADCYALMGSTGPMATNGAYWTGLTGGDANIHLNGRGLVGGPVSGVPDFATCIANSIKAALPQRVMT